MITLACAIQSESLIEDATVVTVVSQAVQMDVTEAGIAIVTVTITKAVTMAAVIAVEGEMPMKWSMPQCPAPGNIHTLLHASALLLKI